MTFFYTCKLAGRQRTGGTGRAMPAPSFREPHAGRSVSTAPPSRLPYQLVRTVYVTVTVASAPRVRRNSTVFESFLVNSWEFLLIVQSP